MYNWREQALCAEVGDELFFTSNSHRFAAAKKICAECPIFDLCHDMCERLEENITSPQYVWGIYAGETAMDRVKRRKRELRSAGK